MPHHSLEDCRRHILSICPDIPLGVEKKDKLPYVYYVSSSYPPRPINISVLGCQGGNGSGKKEVAQNIATNEPDFVIGLGDSFYPHGVPDPRHSLFESHFHNDYSTGALESIPFYLLLGNHDLNFQHAAQSALGEIGSTTRYDRMMAQIIHTYLPDVKKNWNMMSDYYVLVTPYANIFCLNSNFLAFDPVQQEWLKDTYKALNSGQDFPKWNIVAMHHPLHSPGKRYLGGEYDDIDQYTIKEFKVSIDALKKRGVKCLNLALFNLFAKFKEQEKINFDLFLGAHDHLLAAMWQRASLSASWQIISGAAGNKSELQEVKIPPNRQHKDPTKNGTGNDFYHDKKSGNGHAQLLIASPNLVRVGFYNIANKVICEKIFRREDNIVKCEDFKF